MSGVTFIFERGGGLAINLGWPSRVNFIGEFLFLEVDREKIFGKYFGEIK